MVKKPTLLPVLLPDNWKEQLEKSIRSRYASHPKEKDLMLGFLRNADFEAAAQSIWNASRKQTQDASVFFDHLEEVLLQLAISLGLTSLTVLDYRKMAEALEMIRDHQLFFRKKSGREELKRAIHFFRQWEEKASATKPKDPGPRRALQFLTRYFQDYFGEPLHEATGLLMHTAFGGEWNIATVRARAAEWSDWKDASGLKKATPANMTEEKWAALDMLKGEAYEAALEKMSPKLREQYLKAK